MRFINIGKVAITTNCIIIFSILAVFDLTLTDSDHTHLLYVISQSKTCEKAAALAKSDFQKGSYLLIRFGLPETSEITGEVLQHDYGIVQRYPGCVPVAEVECYTQRMYSLLQGRFGAEFYSKARAKASAILEFQK